MKVSMQQNSARDCVQPPLTFYYLCHHLVAEHKFHQSKTQSIMINI